MTKLFLTESRHVASTLQYGLFNAVYCEYCTEHNCIVSADHYVVIIIGIEHIGEQCHISVSEGYTSSCMAI